MGINIYYTEVLVSTERFDGFVISVIYSFDCNHLQHFEV